MFCLLIVLLFFFFFNDTATTEIYTLSLHDALPISCHSMKELCDKTYELSVADDAPEFLEATIYSEDTRSEEHTSELQSH